MTCTARSISVSENVNFRIQRSRRLPTRAKIARQTAVNAYSGTWTRAASIESPDVALIEQHLNPAIVVVVLLLSIVSHGDRLAAPYWALAALAFTIVFAVMSRPRLQSVNIDMTWWRVVRTTTFEWGCAIIVLLLMGVLFKATSLFSRKVILVWLVVTPFALTSAQLATRSIMSWLRTRRSIWRRLVIVGANTVGCELASRLAEEPWLGTVDGFFDDRRIDRLPVAIRPHLLGRFRDLPEYARRNRVHVIYLCLPISAQPRIRKLFNELRDTTASIYFVPNLSAFDLMQARFGEVRGMPLVAVRESPFRGMNGVLKRASDIVLASAILLVVAPFMIAIAIGVRKSSPGQILFQQRRYGLDGKEFKVYKFRTMTVCEDGQIIQATRNDPRVTSFGQLLRRSSLDELPQLLNVLKGHMSLVGPRPHAVFHNEHYRKLVNGYMLRHKVRPGITGLAQVNGMRGETNDLEKMYQRVQFDLEYLKNWSLGLDARILIKTVFAIFRGRSAY
jgi:putative colanic acid biosysnthesis UDP-glucose lipid carrier transferase